MPAPLFSSAHLFTVCNAGSEKLLKADITAKHRGLHPAYMRPQLVTWKSPTPLSHPPASLFARVSGLSLGLFQDEAALAPALASFRGHPLHLHVFPRVLLQDGLTAEQWSALDATAEGLRGSLTAAGVSLHESRAPWEGEWVLDIVLEDETARKFIAGVHRHSEETHPCAGALPRVVLPADVPSRAWLKMEQALVLARFDAPDSLRGRTVLELGSAPGGASLSLLQHGATVFGIDAAEMDRRVLDFQSPTGAHFVHFKMNAGQVPRALLPANVDIFTCDLNAAPHVVIPIVENLQSRVQAPLFLLTLKLNDAETAARIPEYLRRLHHVAPSPLRATQLAANRSEFTVVCGQ